MDWIESARWNLILALMETIVLTLCTWYFFSHTEQNVRANKKGRCGGVFLYWAGLAGCTFGMQNIQYINLILLVYMVVMTVVTGALLYNRSSMYRFYYFLFPITLVAIQIFVIYIVFAYRGSRWGTLIFDYASANVALIIKQLTEILLTGVWIVLLNRKKYENVKGLHFVGLFLPPAVSVCIIFSLLYIGNIYMQFYGAFLIILDIFLLVFMNFYIWHLFSYQSKNKKLMTELEIWKKQGEMQYQYYEKMEQKYQASRKLVHDMRNHLQAIEALQEQDGAQAKAYVRDMHQILDGVAIVNFTNHRMLNIILNDKSEEAEKKGIVMEVQVGEIHLEHIKDMDITTIFGNLLDNALEAAEQADRKSVIQLKADRFHEFTVVRICNSMKRVDTVHQKHDKDDTTELNGIRQRIQDLDILEERSAKGRKPHMGIGLVNVRNTLEKYGGGMLIEATEDEFLVNITIPEKDDGKGEKES